MPFDPSIDELTEAIEQKAQRRPEVERLQNHLMRNWKQVEGWLESVDTLRRSGILARVVH